MSSISGGSRAFGNVTISCPVSYRPTASTALRGYSSGTHLEALRIPLLHFLYARHLGEPVRQALELDDAVREPDGQFFREELGRFEQSALGGLLAEEDHLLEGDWGELGSAGVGASIRVERIRSNMVWVR